MTRVNINNDLPKHMTITPQEMKRVHGGQQAFQMAVQLMKMKHDMAMTTVTAAEHKIGDPAVGGILTSSV